MSDYGGLYRGIVADAADPEQRKRYRVRVVNIHRDEVPTNALPWAEWCLPTAGKGFGDLPSLEVGDPVFIMFEKCDRRFPVILGGWLSYQGGTNDLPNEQLGDYERTQKRWTRIDRAGNKITMSPLEDELFVEIQSGDTKITVRGLDGTFAVESDARTVIRSPRVQVEDAQEVSVETVRLVAQVEEEATVQCGGTVNVQAADEVNIGKYTPPATVGLPIPKTTAEVNIEAAQLVKIESALKVDVDAATDIDIDAAVNVNVRGGANVLVSGTTRVQIQSDGPVEISASELNVSTDTAKAIFNVANDVEIVAGGKVRIEAASDVEIEATGDDVTIAAGGDVGVSAAGDVEVDCAGNATIHAAGLARLESDSKIEIEAPVIEIEASGLLSMESTGTTRLDGQTILIGS